MRNTLLKVTCLSLLSPMCYAHTGESIPNGWLHGFMHPLTGLDHLFALIAIGILASRHTKTAPLILPSVFIGAMIVGFYLASIGVSMDIAEQVIAISVLSLGAWLISGKQLNKGLLLSLSAIFAIAHGYAHGTEVIGNTAHYLAGFISMAFLLISTGFLASYASFPGKQKLQSSFGLLMSALGLFFIFHV